MSYAPQSSRCSAAFPSFLGPTTSKLVNFKLDLTEFSFLPATGIGIVDKEMKMQLKSICIANGMYRIRKSRATDILLTYQLLRISFRNLQWSLSFHNLPNIYTFSSRLTVNRLRSGQPNSTRTRFATDLFAWTDISMHFIRAFSVRSSNFTVDCATFPMAPGCPYMYARGYFFSHMRTTRCCTTVGTA